jgi:iron-sulfur cluster assembly accessory protein
LQSGKDKSSPKCAAGALTLPRARLFLHHDKESAMTEKVQATPSAQKRVAEILGAEAPGALLRISVNGGGCSGFQYAYDIVPAADAGDLLLGDARPLIAIDPISLEYMAGAKIDFVDDLMGAAFKIENPKAVAACGCGTSFSV